MASPCGVVTSTSVVLCPGGGLSLRPAGAVRPERGAPVVVPVPVPIPGQHVGEGGPVAHPLQEELLLVAVHGGRLAGARG